MDTSVVCSHYNMALTLISMSDLNAATAELETHLSLFPGSHQAWHALAHIALLAGEYESSVDFLSQAIALAPHSAAYFSDLGEVYRRLGNLGLARAYLERALEIDPLYLEGLINLGCVLGELQRFDESKNQLLKALELAPERVDVYVNLGVLEQRDGRILYSLNYLTTAQVLAPDHIPALAALGETFRRLERYEEAEHCFGRVMLLDPEHSLARAGLVDIYVTRGEIAAAEKLLAEAPLESEQVPLLLARARLQESCFEYENAIAIYRQAIAEDPKSIDAYRHLVAIYREKGAFDKALELLLDALALDGENCQILLDLAGLCLRDLSYQGAATYFYKQVLGLRPNHVPTWIAVGNSYAECQLFQEAVSCLEHALSLDEENPQVWVVYASVLNLAGDYDKSLAFYRKLEACNWGPAITLHNMGVVLWNMGQYGPACEYYERSYAIDPNRFSSLVNLATVYSDLGYTKKSNAFFKRAEQKQMKGKLEAEFRFNRGITRLTQGKLKKGWEDYEFRPMNSAERYLIPRWEGQSLKDKRILLWQDQGIGDVILFGTIFNEVIQQAGEVIIECASKLVPLLRRTFPRALVVPVVGHHNGHPVISKGVDYQISQSSLGGIFRPTVNSFPRTRKGFLRVDTYRKAYWKNFFGSLNHKFKVGVCWRSKVKAGTRNRFYADLHAWSSILSVPDIHFVNLQYDDCSQELGMLRSEFGLEIQTLDMIDMFNDIDETAAMISALDLVISAPTAVAMISAGLGIETWWLANLGWLGMGTKQHKFFHNLRAFQKPWHEPWEESLGRVALALSERAAK